MPSIPAVKVLPIAVCTVAGKKIVEKLIALRVISERPEVLVSLYFLDSLRIIERHSPKKSARSVGILAPHRGAFTPR